MANVQLHTIEGWRPSGTVGNLDNYLTQKEGVAAATAHPIANAERMEILKHRRPAPYLRTLTDHIKEALGYRTVRSSALGSTALTTLFAERHGVDMSELTQAQAEAFSICGGVYPDTLGDGFSLNYDTLAVTGEGVHTFWQLAADARYGFVNLWCVNEPTPLEGRGDIALISGIQEALAADLQVLIETGDQS